MRVSFRRGRETADGRREGRTWWKMDDGSRNRLSGWQGETRGQLPSVLERERARAGGPRTDRVKLGDPAGVHDEDLVVEDAVEEVRARCGSVNKGRAAWARAGRWTTHMVRRRWAMHRSVLPASSVRIVLEEGCAIVREAGREKTAQRSKGDALLDLCVRLEVDRGRRLVEHDDARVLPDERPCERDERALADA